MSRGRFGDVRRFAVLDSTNRYLLGEARAGAPEGVVAVADLQTAGRGRLGRGWESPPGASLLVSVLLRPPLAPDELHLCTAVVALAAAAACGTVAGVEPGLKWPNDLVVDDHKLAGVLAESVPDPAGPGRLARSVVVGIGVNVAWPGPVGADGTCLDELAGRAVDRDRLLEVLLDGLEVRRRLLDDAQGRSTVVAAWRDRCVTLGRAVRVDLGGEVVTGTATDLTEDGNLLVVTPEGARTVVAGDVVHLRPDPGGAKAII